MLNLKGNQIRGQGLLELCPGLEKSKSLVDLGEFIKFGSRPSCEHTPYNPPRYSHRIATKNNANPCHPAGPDLSDNDIGEQDIEALNAFAVALMMPSVALANISLLYNRIGEAGANALLPALDPSNKRIQQFLVDETLPPPLFEALSRVSAGGKGGKKKKVSCWTMIHDS